MNILLFNPRALTYNPRLPNSILQVAASIDNEHNWFFVDGNLEQDPWPKLENYLRNNTIDCFGVTVMPGPQLKQAIPYSKKIKELYPNTKIVWGGYFASNQYKVCIESGFVDYIINGPGDVTFPKLLSSISRNESLHDIKNLIFLENGKIIKTTKEELLNQDTLPELPYDKLNSIYNLQNYLPRTFLGKKTIGYHSSFGCPFTCSFCAVVPIYNARWKGKSAENIYKDVKKLIEVYNGDSLEFHDNNFFVSEKRTVSFAKLIQPHKINWWGEARIDTMDKYSDESLKILSESGCRMIFFGAETGNDVLLKKMDKGGTQTGAQIIDFATRLKKFNIIPEYSFVLGTPAETEKKVFAQINEDIEFIKKVKVANPKTEIIIYTYSPVPTEGSDLYEAVINSGFQFPKKLEDWMNPTWENFDLRKNPLTPWLKPYMIDRIKNFESVLNACYPTNSDVRLNGFKRNVLKTFGYWRYNFGFYKCPKEINFLHRIWRYRQPEIEGF